MLLKVWNLRNTGKIIKRKVGLVLKRGKLGFKPLWDWEAKEG